MSVYGSREASPTHQPSPSSPPAVSSAPGTREHGGISPHKQLPPSSQPLPPDTNGRSSPHTQDIGVNVEEFRERGDGEGGAQLAGKVDQEAGAPGLVINSTDEDQDPVPTQTSTATVNPDEVENKGTEDKSVLQTEQGSEEMAAGMKEDDQEPSPTRSDYRTPSSISDQHLQELSSGTAENPPHHTAGGGGNTPSELVTGGGRDDVEGEEEDGEAPHGIVFLPHSFPSAEPTATTINSQEEEGGVVKPKPCLVQSGKPVIAGEDSNKHHVVTSAFTRLSPSREPVFVEDGSTVSSVASSFTNHMRKDYSSLSLDRHSDMEESMGVQIEGGQGRGGGRERQGGGGVKWGLEEGEGATYLFPVSNSPVDLVTMLTRLASFTSTLLTALTPKLRHGAVPGLDEPRVVPVTHKHSLILPVTMAYCS